MGADEVETPSIMMGVKDEYTTNAMDLMARSKRLSVSDVNVPRPEPLHIRSQITCKLSRIDMRLFLPSVILLT